MFLALQLMLLTGIRLAAYKCGWPDLAAYGSSSRSSCACRRSPERLLIQSGPYLKSPSLRKKLR